MAISLALEASEVLEHFQWKSREEMEAALKKIKASWQAKEPSAYTKAIEKIPGQVHFTILPGAHRFQSDVETLHNLIEMEFWEVEKFKNKQEFPNKAHSCQLFFKPGKA